MEQRIPKEDIISWKKSPFFPNLVDHLLVKHHTADGVEDGISICYFKPYSQGRARWQGDTIHGVWFDEEPPYSIYGEGLTRTNKYGQFSILTFTPLMGMSDVVTKFLKNPSKSQKVVNMTIYDAEHYIAADAKAIAFGNFKRGYTIVDRIGTRILRDPYTNKPFVGFYTTKRTGGMLVDSQAIKLLKIAVA
ncbi:TPA: phage major capsid protein [Escherichia coli]|uniref:phage major capsid protein n=1 Tax=Escherichia coli TaxID=562 RepID=UPI002250A7F7|nr:phage major capsid protein [Escherichia coli]